MNPLSPLTYYYRHKQQTLLLLVLISLMTLGVSVMVRLPDSFLEHMYYSESYATRVSRNFHLLFGVVAWLLGAVLCGLGLIYMLRKLDPVAVIERR